MYHIFFFMNQVWTFHAYIKHIKVSRGGYATYIQSQYANMIIKCTLERDANNKDVKQENSNDAIITNVCR